MIGLDIDDLQIENYRVDEILSIIENYIEYFKCQDNYQQIQNYAFLRLCLDMWFDDFFDTTLTESLISIIEFMELDDYIKDIMKNIIYGNTDVDLKELLKVTNSEDKFMKILKS